MLEDTHRLYNCTRCGVQVRICRRCDRGNCYCPGPCAAVRRQESLRRAGNRYQCSYRGACRHAARQRVWRTRQTQKVTHQGSLGAAVTVTVAATSTPAAIHHADIRLEQLPNAPEPSPLAIAIGAPGLHDGWSAQRTPQSALRCHFCQRALTPFARLGPLRGGP